MCSLDVKISPTTLEFSLKTNKLFTSIVPSKIPSIAASEQLMFPQTIPVLPISIFDCEIMFPTTSPLILMVNL